ncbi:MAG: gliding motility protein GldM [Bacteroidales bacterium]|nr:gliding motility protein GldM [Bacteroidales bacterium]
MGHGKETPRQKMIGMMYLVLTAMLALNVSKDVLDAFVIVDHGLNQTTHNYASKNDGLYNKFDLAFQQNPDKVKDWKQKSDEVRQMSSDLYNFINECKVEIVSANDPEAIIDGHVELDLVEKKDNTDTPAEIMIVKKKGVELKEMINNYREKMIDMIEDPEEYAGLIESIKGNLDTHDHPAEKAGDPDHPWESHNFEHLPLASVITILSKMQADVRNVESDVISYLLQQVDAKDFKVNVIKAIVLPNSNVVFKGQEYKARVLMAGYDSTKVPEVVLENGQILDVENGMGIYSTVSNSPGPKNWGGILRLDNDGQIIEKEFTATYRVAEANAVISPTKMNVFYRGVDNPVSISASGVTESAVKPVISDGTILKVSPGNYIVQPGPRETSSKISVYADVEGKDSFMGEMNFRVLNLPTPTAIVKGLPAGSGFMSLSNLTRLQKVEAVADEFLFEVEFTVTGFKVNVIGAGGINKIEESNSAEFTNAQKDIFRSMRAGQRVFIEDIEATGPDGVKRILNNITIKIR